MKALSIAFCSLLTQAGTSKTIKKITIYVDDNYQPFSFEHRGEAKGMYVDVLKVAFSRMKEYKVALEPIPWNRGKRLMEKGTAFGLAPAYFHGHDWTYLYPYSQPFYLETVVAVCRKAVMGEPRDKWPEDYKNLKIGNVSGFDGWGGELFKQYVKSGIIKYEEAFGSAQSIVKLVKGRVDCIMMEDKAFDHEYKKIKKQYKGQEGFQWELRKGATIGKDTVHIGFSKPARLKGDYPFILDFMQAFDSEIYQMVKSKENIEIMNNYKDP